MKRANYLYERIPTHDNLALAFHKAARGKHGHPEVIRFRGDFERNIEQLRRQLLSLEPDVGHYHFFTIRDPKVRTVCAAAFPERVLHHAIMNVCEPVFDRFAIHDTYACRVGKGNRLALARAKRFAGVDTWFLKLDIRKYFDSIDHKIAIRLLARRFKENELLVLFQRLLDTYQTRAGKGIPIGNLFSQHLANFYLGGFDHWIKEERGVKHYLRYMDDFLLFGEDKEALKIELEAITVYLSEELGLELKGNVQLNRVSRGVPFLGFRVFPGHIRLLPQSKQRFIRKFCEYEQNFREGIWTEDELARHMEALIDFTRAADSLRFRRLVFERYGVLS